MSSTTRPTPDGSSFRQTLAALTAAAEDLGAGVAAQHLAVELERRWQRGAAPEAAA